MDYEVCVDGLAYGYSNDLRVLEGINLKIRGPQLISIIGPNGVGKSTFMHCLNKILTPSEGTVLIEDIDVKDYKVKDLAKKMGFVPNSTGDAFPMTVMDTVLMGRYPTAGHRITNDDVNEAYRVLKLLKIEHLAMRNFDQLSAGQHQKVALARGIVQHPRILMLDEPTSNLDIRHQMDVSRILKEMTLNEDIVVIMISHDLNIAAKYSDRIIMLYDKGIFAIGAPSEVITPENIRAVYDVESTIVMDEGRPHVILRDSDFDPCAGASEDAICIRR